MGSKEGGRGREGEIGWGGERRWKERENRNLKARSRPAKK